jgi:hypothetical protein
MKFKIKEVGSIIVGVSIKLGLIFMVAMIIIGFIVKSLS